MPELITTKEAISLLECSLSTFKAYLKRQDLHPSQKVGGKNYFDKNTILNFTPPNPLTKKGPKFNRTSRSGMGKTELIDVIEKWRVNSRDTSSADVQIGIYTEKITQMEEEIKHIPTEDPDFKNMRYKLLRHVGERRKLLIYLKMSDYVRYRRALTLINKERRVA